MASVHFSRISYWHSGDEKEELELVSGGWGKQKKIQIKETI